MTVIFQHSHIQGLAHTHHTPIVLCMTVFFLKILASITEGEVGGWLIGHHPSPSCSNDSETYGCWP